MKTLLGVLAICIVATTARADDACTCTANTDHPGMGIPVGPNGDCDSADDSPCYDRARGGSSQVNPAVGNGAAKVFGSIFVTIGFMFLPGHVAEAFSDGPKESAEHSHLEWAKYVAQREATIKAAQDAKKSRAALWKLIDEERAELRNAIANKPALKPFHPPKLKPDLHYECDYARTVFPLVHTGGPVGFFANEEDMNELCREFVDAPTSPLEQCAPDKTYRCGVDAAEQARGEPERCCPRTHPILNLCDRQCYRDVDFRRGLDETNGRHCTQSRDCATFNPTNPTTK